MSLSTIALILWIIFIISMIHEPRSILNGIMVIFNILITMISFSMEPGINGKILGLFIMSTPLMYLIISIFLIFNGIQMIKKEGHKIQNLLSLITGICMIIGAILTILGLYYFQDESIMRSIFYLILIIELYLLIMFISLLIYSLIYTYIPKEINCDYIIVHGCALKDGKEVSKILKARVDKAVKIYNKKKKPTKIVVSGGQGSDELISEAQAMKNYLLKIDFPEEDIIMEDKSTTTFENLKFTRDMINNKNSKFIFVTNNYHVFRTSLFTKKLKMNAKGVGCRTAFYYWPSAFIREYIAIMVKYKWVFPIIILFWIIIELLIH